jgi:pimeloyl-ACP methyl ester carboxylesterase
MRTGNFLATITGAAILFVATAANAIIVEESAPRTAAATISPTVPLPTAHATSRTATETIVLAQAHGPRASNAPQVFLLKGLADVFSAGMDTLAAKLAQRGIPARVANHSTSDSLADDVVRRYKAGGRGPVVIIGHSLGADAAVEMAQRLNEARVPVALVVGFGPTRSFDMPPNVARAVNYYSGYTSWRGARVANVNTDGTAGVNHFNVDKIDRLQNETVSRVIAAIGGGRSRATATQSQAVGPR